MVLTDLGSSLRQAFQSFNKTPLVDEKTLDLLLKDVCKALLQADVNVKLVQNLRKNIREIVDLENIAPGTNKQKLIHKAVVDELCRLVDPGVEPFIPKKGRCNVIMFVGLQGSGKTTSCTKFAYYYQKKGFKTGLICADTYRAGAFDQLKQNAMKAKVPYYGSYNENDAVQIVSSGIQKFKNENFELIIVDTSGRHKHETELFDEMKQIAQISNPDQIIFVMDGAIGQAADAQARAFKSAVDVGSIIITKMDGHAKGGGAISGVAATSSPIIFIGTGEHIHDLEKFTVKSFISKLLGMGDIGGLIEVVKDMKLDSNTDLQKRLEKGQCSLRDMYDQFQMLLNMGPLSKVMGMFPGFTSDMFQGSEKETGLKLKRYMTIMDSMNAQELDSDAKGFSSQANRIERIARGSGTQPQHVSDLVSQYKKFSGVIKKLGGNKGLLKTLGSSASGNPNQKLNATQKAKMNQQMSKIVDPGMLKQMGGFDGLQDLMKQLQAGG